MLEFIRMKNSLLLVLTFSGLCVLSTNVFREYHYVNNPKTWAEAQEYCRDVYADLATIDSQAGNSRLLSGIQDPGKHAWIGLYNDPVRWKWTLGNVDFNKDEDFSNWKSNEPNNKGFRGCVVILTNGQWCDMNCETDRPAVCFNEQDPRKYILVETHMTWSKALHYCRSNYTDLAQVRSMSEVNAIHPMLKTNHWIGLSWTLRSSWSDGSPVTFKKWSKGQPDNHRRTMASCAAVNTTTGTWFDDDCEKKQAFICQTLIPPRIRIKLKFQSEADLSDPDIQQQILEQLHAKLAARGITDFKLHWTESDGLTFHKEQSKRKQGSGN